MPGGIVEGPEGLAFYKFAGPAKTVTSPDLFQLAGEFDVKSCYPALLRRLLRTAGAMLFFPWKRILSMRIICGQRP